MPTEPPPDAPYVDPVERKIREAIDRGEFEALPGAGKPIPDLDRPYEAAWWAKRWVERSRLEDEAADLQRVVRRETPLLRAAVDAEAASRRVDELNRAIASINQRLDEADRIRPISL
ncbi:MAG: DUF1992 domain-containing protein [Acidimicrobiia bacterium]